MVNEDEMGQGFDKHGVEEEHPLNLQEHESHEFIESVDKFQPVVKKMKLLEVITSENICQTPEEFPLSIVTPELKLPEVAALQTPAPKERRKIIKKKKKTLFDSTTKVPAEEIKRWISDPSDLKCERKKVSASRLHVWRPHKLGNMPESFFDPLIPGIAVNLGSLEYETSRGEQIKPGELSDSRDDVVYSIHQEISNVRSPAKEHSPEQVPIAPATPVSCLNLLTAVADSDNLGPSNTLEIMEKSLSSCEGLELDAVFREETNSFDGDSTKEDVYSTRTRMTESYLGRKFMEKKRRKEEEVLNLSQLLAGKTKKENARLFYDILVLKTRNSIDVQQERAYDDILLKRLPNCRRSLTN
ncbi:hypothetical protein CDL12_28176 [Handroanthus impetiginosus]|uniref:Rad21/Rec8-like protein C-terminal eukaryotic domain-containing protein n=1 Tax=Handroanthus impetiginosus TaxID=429701 RepID=A0A2G9G340_9LAMI|nr:hypothetical protein CDL12_28176 [Handroanthus impetiginosus]